MDEGLDTKTLTALERLGNDIRSASVALIHEVAPDKLNDKSVTHLTDALVMLILTGVAMRFKAK